MDWSTLLAGGPFAGLLSQGADPTTAAAAASPALGAPMNIVPPVAAATPQQSPGILNQQGSNDAISQALKMVQQPAAAVPAQAQIQYAKPVGSAAGFDPSRILAAIRGASPTST